MHRLPGAVRLGGFLLKPRHDLDKLLVGQRALAALELALVDFMDQLIVRLVGRRVQLAACRQIIQYFQVGDVGKKPRVSVGALGNILDQRFVALAPGTLHDLGRLYAVNVQKQAFHRIIVQVHAVDLHHTAARVQPAYAAPEVGRLTGQVFVFNAQPFAFVQGAKQIAADRVHRLRPPFRGQ